MQELSATYTPAQLLDAGRRAEAEGRLDHSVQAYAQLVEAFPATAEGQTAQESLQRLGRPYPERAPAAHPSHSGVIAYQNRAYHERVGEHEARASARPPPLHAPPPRPAGRRPLRISPVETYPEIKGELLPERRPKYLLGRVLARLLTWAGGFGCLAALAVMSAPYLGHDQVANVSERVTSAVGATAVIAMVPAGLAALLLGQLARALFALANANRELADLAQYNAEKNAGSSVRIPRR